MDEQPRVDDEPHDILAAEEFVMPTRDERFPPDPSGIHDAHDVLAAEEFAIPVPETARSAAAKAAGDPRALIPLGVAGLVLLVLLRRRR